MKKEYKQEIPPDGKKVYYCNPELNTECNKYVCVYNTNAIDPCCFLTTKEKFALEEGCEAERKAYPPVEKIGL